jgi:hypothetical protein
MSTAIHRLEFSAVPANRFPPNDKIGPPFTELICTKDVWQVKMQ